MDLSLTDSRLLRTVAPRTSRNTTCGIPITGSTRSLQSCPHGLESRDPEADPPCTPQPSSPLPVSSVQLNHGWTIGVLFDLVACFSVLQSRRTMARRVVKACVRACACVCWFVFAWSVLESEVLLFRTRTTLPQPHSLVTVPGSSPLLASHNTRILLPLSRVFSAPSDLCSDRVSVRRFSDESRPNPRENRLSGREGPVRDRDRSITDMIRRPASHWVYQALRQVAETQSRTHPL